MATEAGSVARTRAGWQIVNALWRFADGYHPVG